MKHILIFTCILLIACKPDAEHEYEKTTYDITYTDGTHEIVALEDNLKFSDGDCITTCGCNSSTFKRCGVRKFDAVASKPVSKQKDTLVIILPKNLKN